MCPIWCSFPRCLRQPEVDQAGPRTPGSWEGGTDPSAASQGAPSGGVLRGQSQDRMMWGGKHLPPECGLTFTPATVGAQDSQQGAVS